jgi:hypothetical protein
VQRVRRRDQYLPLVGASAPEALRALRSLTTNFPPPFFDVTIASEPYSLPETLTHASRTPGWLASRSEVDRLTSERFGIYYGHLRLLTFWCYQAYGP